MWAKEWVVHSQPAGRGEEAIGYLARYVQSTALGNKSILADDERGITFSYTDAATRVKGSASRGQAGERRKMTLAPREFLRRVLSHVLPDGLHKVRYFGYLHPKARRRYHQVATLLETPIRLTHPTPTGPPLHLRCPHCRAFALQIVGRLPRCRDP